MALPERIRQIRQFLKGAPQQPQRPGPSFFRRPAAKKPASSLKPKALFEEKKHWPRTELERKWRKESRVVPGTGGKMYSRQEIGKMFKEEMSYQKFGSHITESEAKRTLRELRQKEYQAKIPAEKSQYSKQRRYLEERTGLRGKY